MKFELGDGFNIYVGVYGVPLTFVFKATMGSLSPKMTFTKISSSWGQMLVKFRTAIW